MTPALLSQLKTCPACGDLYGASRCPRCSPERPKALVGGLAQPPAITTAGGLRIFTIPGQPLGKPRMTQRDKWAKRPAVLRYRAWADRARAAAGPLPTGISEVSWVARFAMPASWSKKKRGLMAGRLHQSKPDRDNVDKAVLDSLFTSDSGIALGTLEKRWCEDGQEGITVTVR